MGVFSGLFVTFVSTLTFFVGVFGEIEIGDSTFAFFKGEVLFGLDCTDRLVGEKVDVDASTPSSSSSISNLLDLFDSVKRFFNSSSEVAVSQVLSSLIFVTLGKR